jgi:hypothetical protein
MRIRLLTLWFALLAAVAFAPAAVASPQDFGLEAVSASLSTTQAGDHPDLSLSFEVKQDPASKANVFGLHDSYAPTKNVRIELPPGLLGNPNALGSPQQCTVQELLSYSEPGGGCQSGSQVGVTRIFAYELTQVFNEPVYMMVPPEGEDVVARVGFIAGIFPTFVDFRIRSESDYGAVAEIAGASAEARVIRADTTTWGVPAAHSHDTERCTVAEAFQGCVTSPSRPPGSRPLPFLTNPTRCGVPQRVTFAVSSWAEPTRFDEKAAPLPPISGCDQLPFGPEITAKPTSQRASSPTGADLSLSLPAAEGVGVLEPSQIRDVEIAFPPGVAINPGAADGLVACSAEQVALGTRNPSNCPDAAKLATAEFEIPALPRRMRGAIYLRDPEPGDLFRVWIVADDLGAHVKLPADLAVSRETGEITSVALDLPQVPLREAKVSVKSGLRAPLANPAACGDFASLYDLTPWSGGPDATGSTPWTVDEGCEGLGAFAPKLSAGSTDPTAGRHSPFVFTLTREDGEQNPASLDVSLPTGWAATLAGVPLCVGSAAESGNCPPGSRMGKVVGATGVGRLPLWAPQPGKRPTAVYLAGPYRGAPLSMVAVVPAQAGPFDLGDIVVRSAIYVDPVTAEATVRSDALPQIIEGIPLPYRTIHVAVDRPEFGLNPTNCEAKATVARVTSTTGAVATPRAPYRAADCARLPFRPKLSFQLTGKTHRGAFPRLRARLKGRPGDANIAGASVTLPGSGFLVEQGHLNNVCTRVQFAAKTCPAGSVYGHAVARSPLFDFPLEGPVYLRSSSHELPDLVAALQGPASMPIEVDLDGRIDSINGAIRNTFELVPDAPVREFVLDLQGGKKGLLINEANICKRTFRATARFKAQNGRLANLHPALRVAGCNGSH